MFELLGNNIHLTIIIRKGTRSKRNSSWFINNIKGVNVLFYQKSCFNILKKEMPMTDVFINSMYSTKAGIEAIILSKLYKKTSVLQADGGFPVNRGVFINFLIGRLMLLHNYYFSSSDFTDNYFNYYSKNKRYIYKYPFSSLTEKDVSLNFDASVNKQFYKNKLGLNNFTFISVGQPIYRKGFDLLLRAFKNSHLDQTCDLLIIGGQPEIASLNLVEELNIKNVHFFDSLPSEILKEYYASADSFILCTREDIWGLVINEAISFNLPFITSDKCIAGLHFNKFHNIGTIVKNEDINGYTSSMIAAYTKKETPNYLEISKQYTIEKTVKDLLDSLENICKKM